MKHLFALVLVAGHEEVLKSILLNLTPKITPPNRNQLILWRQFEFLYNALIMKHLQICMKSKPRVNPWVLKTFF